MLHGWTPHPPTAQVAALHPIGVRVRHSALRRGPGGSRCRLGRRRVDSASRQRRPGHASGYRGSFPRHGAHSQARGRGRGANRGWPEQLIELDTRPRRLAGLDHGRILRIDHGSAQRFDSWMGDRRSGTSEVTCMARTSVGLCAACNPSLLARKFRFIPKNWPIKRPLNDYPGLARNAATASCTVG